MFIITKLRSYLGSAMLGAIAANFGTLVAAASFSWASPVGPKLQSDDTSINPLQRPTTVLENSLLASIIIPGNLVGTLLANFSTKIFGRKKTLLIFCVPMLLSHLICAFALNIEVFLFARFLIGIGAGTFYSVVPGYVAEIATHGNRGALGVLMSIFGSSAGLFSYSLGPFVSIKMFSFLNIVPIVIFFVIFPFCAESPYELIKNGKIQQAQKTLMRLRDKCDVLKEIALIETIIIEQSREKYHLTNFYKDQTLRKAITLTCTIMFFQQFSGVAAFASNMQNIFESSQIPLPSKYAPIIVVSISLSTSLVATQFMDRLGRRFALITSMLFLLTANILLGLYFFFKGYTQVDVSMVSWLPLFGLIVFFMGYASGLSSVPSILIGEYFPSQYKNLAASITFFMCFSYCGIVTLCFPLVNAFIGEAVSFLFFAFIVVCGIIFCFLKIPETKGLTFLEIQNILGQNTKKGLT